MSHFVDQVKELGEENKVAFQNFAHENPVADDMVVHRLHPESDVYKIPLEEFLYFAEIQREAENDPNYGRSASMLPEPEFLKKIKIFGKKNKEEEQPATVTTATSNSTSDFSNEKNDADINAPDGSSVSGESSVTGLVNANRALRTATWMNVFYLITTDILGPTGAPYAISQLGFVPGTLLFVLLGASAAYTGYLLWKMFLKLDSAHYPLRSYGDLVGRVYGKSARYGTDVLQALQLICNVAVIILGNGQGLYQIAQYKVCFSVMVVVWALAGMVVGQIRTLQKFGFLANLAIWMNLFVCFATMGVVAHSQPNYQAALAQNGISPGPVITKVVISGSGNFAPQLQATMNIVYSYGGAMVFINFLAEMRRPWDFWKGMATAQSVIFVCYLLYGLFVYAYQGQFVINPGNQGISGIGWAYKWQTALNVISLVSALIAAGLYGNVGIKVVYNTFVQRIIKGPQFEDGVKGRLTWFTMVIIYWALAFVIASAIPQFSTLTSLVGAVCILQFTYTFPPLIALGFDLQLDAMKADGAYDVASKQTSRLDTWKNGSRWWRALKQRPLRNGFHLIMFLAAAATAVLGIYASAIQLKAAYGSGSTTAFGCKGNI